MWGKRKKYVTVFMTMVLVIQSLVTGASFSLAKEGYGMADESKISNQLNDYNVFLTGYHSADSADIEGPVAVKKDSSIGKETLTFSYGALFEAVTNGVGVPLDFDRQKTALLIGGNIINHSETIKPIIVSGSYKGEKIGWLDSTHVNDATYFNKVDVVDAQKKQLTDLFSDQLFTSMEEEMNALSNDLASVKAQATPKGKTLGEWSGGKLVEYDYFESLEDSSILVLNIPPKEVDGELIAVVDSFGFDYDTIIQNDSIKNIVVTSVGENGKKPTKIVFKGNYLTNKDGGLAPLALESPDAKDHAKKIVYSFSDAVQVTNFFDKESEAAEVKAPQGITQLNSGVTSSGNLEYYKDYLSQYATASSSNGTANSGGGAAVIGSVVAPKASVVFSGGNINGYLFATDLHQRNGMEVHNFWNTWFTRPSKGLISIIKQDSDTNKTLSGAEFDVLDSKNNKVDHIVTEENGQGHTTVPLEFGDYTLVETKAPKGYEINKTPIPVKVIQGEQGNVKTVIIKNKQKVEKGSISLIKRDSSDKKTLSGAEFDVINKDGKVVDHIITTTNGQGNTTKPLEFGDYTLIETKAPEGYELDKTPIKVVVKQGNQTTVTTVEVENSQKPGVPVIPTLPGKGTISLTKYDTADKQKRLAGAEFDVKDKTGKIVDHLITDEKGQAVTTVALEFGDYALVETVAPKGYELDGTPISVKVVEGKESNVAKVEVGNSQKPGVPIIPGMPGKGTISIIKHDSLDKQKLLAGAEFDVKDKNDQIVDHIVTNEKGQGHTKVALDFDTYKLIETVAPKGYELDSTPIFVDVLEGKQTNIKTVEIKNRELPGTPIIPTLPGKGAIHVVKQDAVDKQKRLAGAEFDVKDKNGKVVDHIVTGKDGQGYSTVPLEFGDYTLVETIAPAGYELNNTPVNVSVVEGKDSNVALVEIKNSQKPGTPIIPGMPGKGSIHIIKLDAADDQTYLAGAEFDVKDKTGNVIDHIVTGPTGHGQTMVPLEFGDYTLIETVAPIGYELNSTPTSVSVKEGKETNVVTIEMKNSQLPGTPIIPGMPGKGSIHIIKHDAADKQKRLAGAEFDVKDKNNTLVDHIVTGEDGIGRTTVALEFGQYTLIETKAPTGYELDATPKIIEVVEGKESNIATIDIENSQKPGTPIIPGMPGKGSIHIIKHDAADGQKYLSGATFNVLDSGGTVVDEIVTDETGHGQTDTPLEFGDYTLVETIAPTGYDLDATPVPVTVVEGEYTNIVTFMIKNRELPGVPVIPGMPGKGSIHVIKHDSAERQTFLAGAKFVVKDKNGLVIDTIVTGKTGHGQTTEPLAFGDYTLVETVAPKGYELDTTPIPVKVVEGKTSNIVTIDIENRQLPGTPIIPTVPGKGGIEVIKHDSADKTKRLSGAEFDVLDSTGKVVDHIKTGKDGKGQTSKALEFGDYTLVETVAPKGYELDTTPIPVKVVEGKTSNIVTIDIENRQLPGTPIIPTVPGKGGIEVIKHDSADKTKRLSGAEFDVLDSTGKVVDHIKTGKDGKGQTSKALEFGDYTLVETVAPKGYELDGTPISIKVVEGKISNVTTVEVQNKLLRTSSSKEKAVQSKSSFLPRTGEARHTFVLTGLMVISLSLLLGYYRRKNN